MFLLSSFVLLLTAQSSAPQEIISPGERYIQFRTLAMQEDATKEDIERVLSIFTGQAVYEHPTFNMRIVGIESMRSGRQTQLGATRRASAVILSRARLQDVEAITEELSFEARDGDSWRRVTRKQLLLFEYSGGLVTHVLEYWEK